MVLNIYNDIFLRVSSSDQTNLTHDARPPGSGFEGTIYSSEVRPKINGNKQKTVSRRTAEVKTS